MMEGNAPLISEGDAPPVREKGWWKPILALTALLILPVTPLLRIVTPIDQTTLLLMPALAACAVAGWYRGGRLPLAVFWAVLAAMLLWPSGGVVGAFPLMVRGWTVTLAAVFGALTVGEVGEDFISRGLITLGLTLLMGGLIAIIAAGGVEGAYEIFTAEIARRAEFAQYQWREMISSDQWIELLDESPEMQRMSNAVEEQLAASPQLGNRIFPAMLALESLAALALSWAVYHRIGRARLGPPLSRLKDFRFNDLLVWGVIAGLLLMVFPTAGLLRGIGVNLLVFFGVLYVLRGMGVIIWFLTPGRWMTVLLVVFTLLFWHAVGMVAAVIGLGDTWFDWRRRVRPKSQRSE